MVRVLLAVSGNFGFAPEAVRLAQTMLQQGHEVVVLTAPGAAAAFTALGVEVERVEEPEMPQLSRFLPPLIARARQLHQRVDRLMLAPMAAQWDALHRVLRRSPVDVVVSDGFCFGVGVLGYLPRSERPAVIELGYFPPVMPDAQVAPYGLGVVPEAGAGNPVRTALLELVAARAYADLGRRYRAAVRRLTGVEVVGDVRTAVDRCDVWAQLTVPRFEYPRTALPAGFRFIGALRPAEPDAPPEWWDESVPVVVVLPDAAQDPAALVGPAVEAFGGGATAVLIAGARAVEAVGAAPLPSNVHVERQVPWSYLHPRTTAVLTAGDYVDVQHALRHGLPVLAAGTLETQVETAARLRWSGAGVDLATSRPTAEQVRDAVHRVLEDAAMRLAAARIAAQLDPSDAESALLQLVVELAAEPAR